MPLPFVFLKAGQLTCLGWSSPEKSHWEYRTRGLFICTSSFSSTKLKPSLTLYWCSRNLSLGMQGHFWRNTPKFAMGYLWVKEFHFGGHQIVAEAAFSSFTMLMNSFLDGCSFGGIHLRPSCRDNTKIHLCAEVMFAFAAWVASNESSPGEVVLSRRAALRGCFCLGSGPLF